MVGFLLVSHGGMAKGMLEAIAMITGVEDQIAGLGLYPEDSPETLVDSIREQIAKLDTGDGVIMFVDLLGATPFNSCVRLLLEKPDQYALICGMNLPMLLELSMLREGKTVAELAETAVENGKNGVVNFILPPMDE